MEARHRNRLGLDTARLFPSDHLLELTRSPGRLGLLDDCGDAGRPDTRKDLVFGTGRVHQVEKHSGGEPNAQQNGHNDEARDLSGDRAWHDATKNSHQIGSTSGVNMYPPRRTVLISEGSRGSGSIFCRMRLTWTSTLRSTGPARPPYVNSSNCSRESTSPGC